MLQMTRPECFVNACHMEYSSVEAVCWGQGGVPQFMARLCRSQLSLCGSHRKYVPRTAHKRDMPSALHSVYAESQPDPRSMTITTSWGIVL